METKVSRLQNTCQERLVEEQDRARRSLSISTVILVVAIIFILFIFINPAVDSTGKMISLFLFSFAFFFILITMYSSRKIIKKENDDFPKYEHYADDFENAKEIGNYFVSEKAIYDITEKISVIEFSTIIWAYYGSDAEVETASGRNPFNKRRIENYGVHVFTGPNKGENMKTYSLKEQEAKELLPLIAEKSPNAFIGMDKAYRSAYFKKQ